MTRDYLSELGWGPYSDFLPEKNFPSNMVTARVISVSRGSCVLAGEAGESAGVLAGKFYQGDIPVPVVGDWVLVRAAVGDDLALVQDILPRRNSLSRKMPGKKSVEQVMAANIDVMFIVQDVLRTRVPLVERYLALAGGSGIRPVIIINKCDLDPRADDVVREIASRIPGISTVALSALTGDGLGAVTCHLSAGLTACLLGPSGAGKSSIVNRLLGEERQKVADVRAGDRKGKHATTSRELFSLPGGGMLIDTPGMRELMPWDGSGLDESFSDIDLLAAGCRYGDCRHETEPGCAVRRAAETGDLDPLRLENFLRLKREMAYLESRVDDGAHRERKRKEKELHRFIRDYNKNRDRY